MLTRKDAANEGKLMQTKTAFNIQEFAPKEEVKEIQNKKKAKMVMKGG